MNKEKKLIPELRFPEFVKEGEWSNEELGQISEIVRGGSPRPIQEYLTKDVNGLNWLKIADVPSDSKYITETKEKVINEALSSTREVNPGDLILSNSMSFGRPYILKIKTCIHDGWIAIRKISNKTYEDYLYYFISSENSQSYFKTNAAGAAVKNLNADIIKLLPIYLPKNKKEQQKIASCLSSLDELITAHNDKLQALKDHKKGLMQNLFPQMSGTGLLRLKDEQDEDEILSISSSYKSCSDNLPKLRFPEFEKDGEWEEKKLGDEKVSDFVNEKIDSKKLTLDNYISTDNMLQDYSGVTKATKLPTTPRVTKFNEGDILISNIRPYLRKVWKSDIQGGSSSDVLVFRAGSMVSSDFLEFILKNDDFINYVMQSAKGVKMPRGDKDAMMEYAIRIPSKIEQQKIASCLSALDALITAQAEKIEQLQQHKKGLMQGLFP